MVDPAVRDTRQEPQPGDDEGRRSRQRRQAKQPTSGYQYDPERKPARPICRFSENVDLSGVDSSTRDDRLSIRIGHRFQPPRLATRKFLAPHHRSAFAPRGSYNPGRRG